MEPQRQTFSMSVGLDDRVVVGLTKKWKGRMPGSVSKTIIYSKNILASMCSLQFFNDHQTC
jgi:hypothetical protein